MLHCLQKGGKSCGNRINNHKFVWLQWNEYFNRLWEDYDDIMTILYDFNRYRLKNFEVRQAKTSIFSRWDIDICLYVTIELVWKVAIYLIQVHNIMILKKIKGLK